MSKYDDYEDDDGNTYGGVCLNCGSAKCGYHGGCRDKDDEEMEESLEEEV